MNYTVVKDHGLGARDPTIGWDANAPGLYELSREGAPAPESVVELNTGERIAVSIEETYVPTTLDVSMRAYARYINDDGSTKKTPDGKDVEVEFSFNVSRADIEEFGIDTFRREGLKVVLGEPRQEKRPIQNDPNAQPLTDVQREELLEALRAEGKSPDATLTLDPDATETYLIDSSEENVQSNNIRKALDTFNQMTTVVDPASLLG